MTAPNPNQALLSLAARVLESEPDRDLDAEVAIALFDRKHDRPDPRDHEYARKPIISHGARPGNFEIVAFSGVSLRTAYHYTLNGVNKAIAVRALRARAHAGDPT